MNTPPTDSSPSLDSLLGPASSPGPGISNPQAHRAIALARHLQTRATQLQTPPEKRQQAELDRLLRNPQDKATLIQITDQAFRSRLSRRAVDQFIHILDVQGVPRFFTAMERTLLKGFQSFGGYLPGVAVPLVKERLHKETANVILPAERDLLRAHLLTRREQGIRMNVNILGEAILSEAEAQRRLEHYLQTLQQPEIEVVSVKISTLYSQISPLAREHTLDVLCDRLEMLFRAAASQTYQRADGTRAAKFVYLDMEEYRDMSLTADAFMRTLDRPGLQGIHAGLVLQAYLPDAFATQQRFNEWARHRVMSGGSPVTLRVVKGANMEMERVEAALRGWPQAPFKTKVETDANYKRMLVEGMTPENLAAVRLGIASHNLFDMAYALVLAFDRQALDRVQFEMLEGMANHQRRALFELQNNLLLYSPVCAKDNFIHAIGYLIRRLDENTGPENFLRYTFKLKVGDPEWMRLESAFLASFDAMPRLDAHARRTQDRRQLTPSAASYVLSVTQASSLQLPTLPASGEAGGLATCPQDAGVTTAPNTHVGSAMDAGLDVPLPKRQPWGEPPFLNEPDTDFALPQHALWAEAILARWQPRHGDQAAPIPLVIDGQELPAIESAVDCKDPSRPGIVVGRYRQAIDDEVARAVACAKQDPDGWRKMPLQERFDLLGRVADELRQARADLVGAAIANGGKTILESDPEVSEAVDFVEFYRRTARWFQQQPGLGASGKGVVVVVSPWNFPIAIPCGGIAAALAAGNTVILKPASDTVLVAWELCQCFWRAGVSKRALQFCPCAGGGPGQRLVTDARVDVVILTGGTATAMRLLEAKPDMDLLAETGGKNATIVTGLADRDLAIKNVLHSAFSHAGQKCSATSLLLLEAEVYDDPVFKQALREAVESIHVGSAWDLPTKMGPLIRPPSGDLERGLKLLEPGESWLVMPRRLEKNPNLWSPGVKWGVQPGSFTHLTELFGPVLGVMRFDKLEEAIALVNQTGYGLTSGLESLDDREQDIWRHGIAAGNLYINRPTTGAVVLRQPFGGMGKSAFGPGIKAGGPNYVLPLMNFKSDTSQTTPSLESDIDDPHLAELASKLRGLFQPGNPQTAVNPEVGSMVAKALSAGECPRLQRAIASYVARVRTEFGATHDHCLLCGQDNFRSYLPVHPLRIRMHPDDTLFEIFARICAAKCVGCRLTLSASPGSSSALLDLLENWTESWAGTIEFVQETDEELAEAIAQGQTDRVRYARRDRVPEILWRAAAAAGLYLATAPVTAEGRIELLWYVQEQSLSFDYHRYGNLGARALELRSPVP